MSTVVYMIHLSYFRNAETSKEDHGPQTFTEIVILGTVSSCRRVCKVEVTAKVTVLRDRASIHGQSARIQLQGE